MLDDRITRGGVRAAIALAIAVAGVALTWLGPGLANVYILPVWQVLASCAVLAGAIGAIAKQWWLLVVGLVTLTLLALPTFVTFEYVDVRATSPSGVELFAGNIGGDWYDLRLAHPGLLGQVCWVATVDSWDFDQGSVVWQNGRFLARDENGGILADVPDHC